MTQTAASVVETLEAMYAAAATDDEDAFARIFTEDFYAFDLGRKFVGMELPALIKQAHAEGKKFIWTVTEPDVRLHGDLATITFVNQGAVGEVDGMMPVTWLEAAVLRFEDGRWRIAFFHSTRVPAA